MVAGEVLEKTSPHIMIGWAPLEAKGNLSTALFGSVLGSKMTPFYLRLKGRVLVAKGTFPTYYLVLDRGVFRGKRDPSSALFEVTICDLEARDFPQNYLWLKGGVLD